MCIQQENKENETDNHNSKIKEEESIQKPEDVPQEPQETQNNGIQHEVVEDIAPKLPSYLDNLPYAEGIILDIPYMFIKF